MENDKLLIPLSQAVDTIKTAILQGQYEALKDVNRVQLAVYYAIGKYLSKNTRKGVWGTGALKQISDQLHRELPGLRGYSETQLKEMRNFYENWVMLDSNSSVATGDMTPQQRHRCMSRIRSKATKPGIFVNGCFWHGHEGCSRWQWH